MNMLPVQPPFTNLVHASWNSLLTIPTYSSPHRHRFRGTTPAARALADPAIRRHSYITSSHVQRCGNSFTRARSCVAIGNTCAKYDEVHWHSTRNIDWYIILIVPRCETKGQHVCESWATREKISFRQDEVDCSIAAITTTKPITRESSTFGYPSCRDRLTVIVRHAQR